MRTQPHRVRALGWLGLALTLSMTAASLSLTSCAARREAKLRADWKQAVRASETAQGGERASDDASGGDAGAQSSEWRDLEAYITRIIDQVSLGLATISMDRLADSMCAEAPDVERLKPDGTGPRVFHCTPDPPQTILGEVMTLELSDNGEVGLVATGLSEESSAQLLAQAVESVASWCEDTLRETTHATNALYEFHTCLTPAGPQLAVGRFPEKEDERWQFSLVVLIPG
ncbi:MAG: hypothetical protein H6713_10825 [Myxococcales bacterium]|nr:hypothetical protein [Myxococcales bacterium]